MRASSPPPPWRFDCTPPSPTLSHILYCIERFAAVFLSHAPPSCIGRVVVREKRPGLGDRRAVFLDVSRARKSIVLGADGTERRDGRKTINIIPFAVSSILLFMRPSGRRASVPHIPYTRTNVCALQWFGNGLLCRILTSILRHTRVGSRPSGRVHAGCA